MGVFSCFGILPAAGAAFPPALAPGAPPPPPPHAHVTVVTAMAAIIAAAALPAAPENDVPGGQTSPDGAQRQHMTPFTDDSSRPATGSSGQRARRQGAASAAGGGPSAGVSTQLTCITDQNGLLLATSLAQGLDNIVSGERTCMFVRFVAVVAVFERHYHT